MVLISLLWLLKSIKYILFWLYLWQTKSYLWCRVRDHFNTAKGRYLLVNYLLIVELILLALFFLAPGYVSLLSLVLAVLYVGQLLLFLTQLVRGNSRLPQFTKKATLLSVLLILLASIFAWLSTIVNPGWLVLADILLPAVVSVVVLVFQPFSVLARNRYLKRAKARMNKFTALKVIAITGSYGKTSTKEFLKIILGKKFAVLATQEHQNSEIAIAKCVLNQLSSEHQVFIAEVGAYNKGKVAEVCKVIRPDIGVVTGVNGQHLSLFGSMENLLSAEGGRELDAGLNENGVLIANGENKYCLDLIKHSRHQKRLYATKGGKVSATVWGEEVQGFTDAVVFAARDNAGNMAHFRVPVLGVHHAQNLLGAITVARELGMTFEEIMEAVKQITPEQAGMIRFQSPQGITCIDASYSSNPDGVEADLNYLNLYEGKKAIVMPCLIELGTKAKSEHRRLGGIIGRVCSMAIITSRDYFNEIREGAGEAGLGRENIFLCENPRDAHALITLFCKSGDAVLVEGGKQNELLRLLKR